MLSLFKLLTVVDKCMNMHMDCCWIYP